VLEYGTTSYHGIKREDAPYPYVLSTGFANYEKNIKDAKLIAAWLDPTGKVYWIEQTSLDRKAFANGVQADSAANFESIIVSDPQVAPNLSTFEYNLWVEEK
jgi:hypothetical protein